MAVEDGIENEKKDQSSFWLSCKDSSVSKENPIFGIGTGTLLTGSAPETRIGVALICTSSWGASRGGADQEHRDRARPPACSTSVLCSLLVYKTTGWQQTHARTGARRPGEGMIPRGMPIDWLLACGFGYRQETRDASWYLSLLESGSSPLVHPPNPPTGHG